MNSKSDRHALTATIQNWSLIRTCAILFMLGALLTRGLLTIVTAWGLPFSPGEVASIFGYGLFNDLISLIYWLPVLYLLQLLVSRYERGTYPWMGLHASAYTLMVFVTFFTGIAELLFWEEFQSRFNFIAVDYLVYRREVTGNIMESYPVIPVLTAIIIASIVMSLWLTSEQARLNRPAQRTPVFKLPGYVMFASILFANLLMVDEPVSASVENRYAQELGFNGPYQFFRAFRRNELDFRTNYAVLDDGEASRLMKQTVGTANQLTMDEDSTARPEPLSFEDDTTKSLYDIQRHVTSNHPRTSKPNVMLVVIESLSAKYVGYLGGVPGLTPNLDKLAIKSLHFDKFYATGTRTVRGLEALSLSIPPTPGRSIVKRPDNDGLFSIATVFNNAGYSSQFLYGGYGYFDNMNEFFAGNGFGVLDRTRFDEADVTFSNAWGVSDEDLYNRTIKAADESFKAGQPFFSLVMTTSNHRPYTYPEGKIDIPSGDGRYGAVKYADYAIGKFIRTARHHAWFDNTLFVFVADHTAGSAGKEMLSVPGYHIPLLIYAPQLVSPRKDEKLASQIDVAPTLLDLAGIDYDSWFFGRSLLSEQREERALVANYQKLGRLTEAELTILSPKQAVSHYQDPFGTGRHADGNESDTRKTITWYQGADYVFRHGLNRVR